MFQRYFSFSGVLTVEEGKKLLRRGLAIYLVIFALFFISAFLVNFDAVINEILLGLMKIGTVALLISVASISIRTNNGKKKEEKNKK